MESMICYFAQSFSHEASSQNRRLFSGVKGFQETGFFWINVGNKKEERLVGIIFK